MSYLEQRKLEIELANLIAEAWELPLNNIEGKLGYARQMEEKSIALNGNYPKFAALYRQEAIELREYVNRLISETLGAGMIKSYIAIWDSYAQTAKAKKFIHPNEIPDNEEIIIFRKSDLEKLAE